MRVAAHERGRVHVFAVNRSAQDIAQVFDPPETGADRLQPDDALLKDLTGSDGLEAKGAELIPLADLEGLGLSGYLTDGLDIPDDQVSEHKRRLDALEGYALILISRAFRGQTFALGETAALTHIASFAQPGTDWSSAGDIPSEAARPFTTLKPTPRAERYKSQWIGGVIFAAVMLSLGAIIWMLIA